jgi:hypothetical protein
MANPGKAHHQDRSRPLLYGNRPALVRGLPGGRGRWWSQRGGPERRVSPCRAGCGPVLVTCGQWAGGTARWAVRAGLPAARAQDFVIAASERRAAGLRGASWMDGRRIGA